MLEPTLENMQETAALYIDELASLEISTNLKPEIIGKEFLYLKNINFADNLDSVSGIKLISWDDWNDDFELLIPIDKSHNKIIDFRKPYLFSKNKDLINDILGAGR